MNHTQNAKQLREMIRLLERKLGALDDFQVSCCDITMAQCHALVEIGRAGSISLNELAELLNLEKQLHEPYCKQSCQHRAGHARDRSTRQKICNNNTQ